MRKKKPPKSVERNSLSLKPFYSPSEKLYDSQVGGLQGGKDTFALPSCSSCQLFHANDRHVKLHENLEMRYGTEKERNQEKVSPCCCSLHRATERTHVLCHYVEANGKVAGKSMVLPGLGLSLRAMPDGQMLWATSQRSGGVCQLSHGSSSCAHLSKHVRSPL